MKWIINGPVTGSVASCRSGDKIGLVSVRWANNKPEILSGAVVYTETGKRDDFGVFVEEPKIVILDRSPEFVAE